MVNFDDLWRNNSVIMPKNHAFKKYKHRRKFIFWQLITNFADFRGNNSIFMKGKKIKISSAKKIYILIINRKKLQILLLIIFNI